jgi:hypothetical protein
LSFSASYCFSFLTFAFLLGIRNLLGSMSPALFPRSSGGNRSAGERDLAEAPRPVWVQASRPGERPREELPGDDREQRGKEV